MRSDLKSIIRQLLPFLTNELVAASVKDSTRRHKIQELYLREIS